LIHHAVDHHVADALGLKSRGHGREGQYSVDLTRGQESAPLGRRVVDHLDVLVDVEADVGE
jgi:hypothetical protein